MESKLHEKVARSLALAAILVVGVASAASAKVPPALRGPIATVGDRTVEAQDIQLAAKTLGTEPPPGVTARAWRRALLDRCVDREILGAEALRRGIDDDPKVHKKIVDREFDILMRVVTEKALVPGIRPQAEEFQAIKKSGHYRYLDLYYILLRDDPTMSRRPIAIKITDRARAGARWDSLAKIYSGHPPSAAAGGHFGPVLVKELEPASQDSIAFASVGSVFGPYSGPYGHEVYKVGGWVDVDDDSLMRILLDERTRGMYQNYFNSVLKKYNFAIDSLNAARAMSVLKTETPDSIRASLRPDGTRPSLGVRAEVGIIAHAEGMTLTLGDLLNGDERSALSEHGHMIVKNRTYFDWLVARSFLHELVVRDVRDRGLDKDPAVARELRMARDQVATLAMVTRERPPDPDAKALAAYVQKHEKRYVNPPIRIARAAMFQTADSARAALLSWNGIGFPTDSVLAAKGFRIRSNPPGKPGVDPSNLYPWNAATVAVRETDASPLGLTLRALAPGQFAPVTNTVQGYAVAMMTGRQNTAPMSETEAAAKAIYDWRADMENQWVTALLEKLRATTPVNVVPARLEAVQFVPPTPTRPSRARAAR